MIKDSFSQVSVRVAATIIAAAVIGLFGVGYAFISDKVDKETYEKHCAENERRIKEINSRIDNQIRINAELLETLNRMEVKLTKVETNTEWLIKEK
jgi:hypothetical protein